MTADLLYWGWGSQDNDNSESTFLGFDTKDVADFGMALSIGGYLNQAVGAYYSAKAQQYALKSQALDLEFQQTMAAINARSAELDAQLELEAGRRDVGRVGLQYGQVKGAERARQAAGGTQAGVGSAAEVQASIETAKELDQITISANAVRAANAARTRATGYESVARMAGVNAANARTAGRNIQPWAGFGSSLLAGAGGVAREWVANERQSARYRYGGRP
jgi:hypothetical protein